MAKLTIEQARNCKIFSDASDSSLMLLVDNSRLIRFAKNAQIVGQADSSNDVYFVVEGTARAKSFSQKGKEVSYCDIKVGELFGEFSAIDEAPRSASILAVAKSMVAKLPARYFREAVMTDPNVALALVEVLIEKNRILTERMHEFGTLAVRFRVQSELLRMAESSCDDEAEDARFKIPTHSEIASRICTHREAVTKELNSLVSRGLICVHKRTVYIKHYQHFKQMVGNLDAKRN